MRPLGSSLTALLSLFLLSLPAAPGLAQSPRADAGYDVVIANGRIIDGSGNPWFYADLAIKNGHIAKIGKIDPKVGKRLIDAKGMVVTPGFIDLHTHSDMTVLADGNAESKVRQGVTLDVIGESATLAPRTGGVPDERTAAATRGTGLDAERATLKGPFRRLMKKAT